MPTEGLLTLDAIAVDSAELIALVESASWSRLPLEKVEALAGFEAALSSGGAFS